MVMKQHYVEWFSGHSVPNTLFAETWGGSYGMASYPNGGLWLTKNSTNGGGAAISFGATTPYNRRPFSCTGSVFHIVVKPSNPVNSRAYIGLSDSKGSISNAMIFTHDTAQSTYELGTFGQPQSGSTSGGAYSASTVPTDDVIHHHRLEAKPTSAEYEIDGGLEVTRTETLPKTAMMPHVENYDLGTDESVYNITYMEIYNT
tara:strand:+ start:1585 stop:2190 length:606 start_codon:yes stop_codon:yes gene_type:complete